MILVIINFGELVFLISQKIINALKSNMKHREKYFIRYPNTEKFVQKKKNSAAPRFFNPLVWLSDERFFLVFDILLLVQCRRSFAVCKS